MRGPRPVWVIAFAAVALLLPTMPPRSVGAGGKPIVAAWVELGENGIALARVVTAASSCPALTENSRRVPTTMSERAAPSEAFPVRVCEAALARESTFASVDEVALPLPVANPRRIVVVGDTGCRVKPNDPVQACNDPDQWPWAAVARAAADQQPDLVIHVGDYIYREMPCPAGNSGCAGSPYGDTWETWWTDFFLPAAPLLRAAPWVVVRGNHESCSREGGGWFRLLDPRPYPAPGYCDDYAEPYAVQVGEPRAAGQVRLVVFDSSSADDAVAQPDQVARYRPQMAAAGRMGGLNSWFLSHRPFWALGEFTENGRPQQFKTNPTLQAALAPARELPPGFRLMLSGHLHIFDAFAFVDGSQPQFVIGNGGTAIDPPNTLPLVGAEVGQRQVSEATSFDEFGYFTFDWRGPEWVGTAWKLGGVRRVECRLGARPLCAPPQAALPAAFE